MVGNINFIYPPKYYLGQRTGLKGHEDVIDALGLVIKKRPDVVGVLAGGPWGAASNYLDRLRNRARAVAGSRIKMPGYLSPSVVAQAWADFDCAVHVPRSENCGGVVEPLLAGVPTVAGRVGGLPEVVIEGLTGKTVEIGRPKLLASAILDVLDDVSRYQRLSKTGQQLVRTMFDVQRTAREVSAVYRHILDRRARPPEAFDSERAAAAIAQRDRGESLVLCDDSTRLPVAAASAAISP